MKTLALAAGLLLSGCSSAYMVNLGYGDPITWLGNKCANELGYERGSEEWRDCIYKLRSGGVIDINIEETD